MASSELSKNLEVGNLIIWRIIQFLYLKVTKVKIISSHVIILP